MGVFSQDKKSESTLTFIDNTSSLVDSKTTLGEGSILNRQGGSISISSVTSNGSKEVVNAAKNLGQGAFDLSRDTTKLFADVTKSTLGSIAGLVKDNADQTSGLLTRSLGSIGTLSETKISDGANITAKTVQIGIAILAVIALGYFFFRKKSA